jgi:glycosyltransferase involved in cell wall biosynthesis
MPAALSEAALRAGAEPVGYVEDIYSEFARASVMVVPLWMGAGARVKIVEALAARLPVVTTTLGAEGLGLTPGTHALFADTPESLGDAVADLLMQPGRAQSLAEAGYAFATERFSLDVVSRRTLELCASVVTR